MLYYIFIIGAFVWSAFLRTKSNSVMKSAKLFESGTERHEPKKHLSHSVATRDRKHANRIPRTKVIVSLAV